MRQMTPNIEGGYQSVLDTCTCLHTKMASRTLTNLYDKHLAGTSINSGQFSILVKISILGAPTLNMLAEDLNLKSSTISRALAPLERDGFISMAPGMDKRTRCVKLTEKGKGTIEKCLPRWNKAQEKLLSQLDEAEIIHLLSALQKLSQIAY